MPSVARLAGSLRLENALLNRPWVGLIQVQAARTGPAHQMLTSLRRTSYRFTRSYDLGMWSRN